MSRARKYFFLNFLNRPYLFYLTKGGYGFYAQYILITQTFLNQCQKFKLLYKGVVGPLKRYTYICFRLNIL